MLFQGMPVVAVFCAFGDAVESGGEFEQGALGGTAVFAECRLIAALLTGKDVVLLVVGGVFARVQVGKADENAHVALDEPGDEGSVARVFCFEAGGDTPGVQPVGTEDGVAKGKGVELREVAKRLP